MLVESLRDWNRYDFGPMWKEVMLWVETHIDSIEDGVYEVAGSTIHVRASDSRPWGEARYEYHKIMADVQIVLDGEEDLYNLPARDLTPLDDYDAKADLGFFAEATRLSPVRLVPGLFALLMPWDAHMPLMAVTKPAKVRKMIVKLPVDKLEL